MIIGIPLRYDVVEKNNTFFVTKNLVDLFSSLNCKIRYLIPNQKVNNPNIQKDGEDNFYPLTDEMKLDIEKSVDEVDGVFLPGGKIITDFERYLVRVCKDKNIPVLGVCLGMQIIANFDRETTELISVDNHYQTGSDDELCHKVIIDDHSKLYDILHKNEIMVNSFHRQTVLNDDSFVVSAVDENNVIEAVEVKDTDFVLGVQWHPEISYHFDDNSKLIIHYFLKKCSNRRSNYVDQEIDFKSYRSQLEDTCIKMYITNEERELLLNKKY